MHKCQKEIDWISCDASANIVDIRKEYSAKNEIKKVITNFVDSILDVKVELFVIYEIDRLFPKIF